MYEFAVYIIDSYRDDWGYLSPELYLNSLSTEEIKDVMKNIPSDIVNKLLFCTGFLKICHCMAFDYPHNSNEMKCHFRDYIQICSVINKNMCVLGIDDEKLDTYFSEYMTHFVLCMLGRYYRDFYLKLIDRNKEDEDYEKAISHNPLEVNELQIKLLKYFSENISELVNLDTIKLEKDMIRFINFNVDIEYLNSLLDEVLNEIHTENRDKVYNYISSYFIVKIEEIFRGGLCL